MRDELNEGLPSDRFRIDWWLNSEHVVNRLAGGPVDEPQVATPEYPVLNSVTFPANGLPSPGDTFDPPGSDLCLVEIPADIQRLKSESPALARTWRLHTRQIFETAFARGYTVIDLIRQAGRSYYLLQKDWQNY